MPSGCRFHPRCPVAFDRCPTVDPPLVVVGPDHAAACLLLGEVPGQERPAAAD
jgi:peptide/nickel transport system ATP-binding protein